MKKRNILIIAFSFLGICLIAIGALTLNLFKSDAQPGNLIVNTDEGNDYIRLTGIKRKISATSTEVVTITATVNPNIVVDDTLNWSIAWNGSNSGTVSDYVTMTVSDDTHSVDIQFVKQFSTQIKVTATSNLTPAISASCTVDCYKKTTDINITSAVGNNDVTYTVDNTNKTITFTNANYQSLMDGSLKLKISAENISVGSLYGGGQIAHVSLDLSDEALEALNISSRAMPYNFTSELVKIADCCGLTYNILNNTENLKAIANIDHLFDLTISYKDYDSSSSTINTINVTFKLCGFNLSDGVNVSSLTLNDTSIIFK